MSFTLPRCLLALTISALLAAHPGGTSASHHVVLVSIDGLAAYHLENEELELPNLRALIRQGAWAEGAQTVFPSVTHPSHATLITGVSPRRHGILGNNMTNRETGASFHISSRTRQEAIQAPTIFDMAHEAGLVTAAVCWPETRGDGSVDFNVPHGHDELNIDDVDPVLLAELREAGIPIDSYYEWAGEGRLEGHRDLLRALVAAHLIREHRPHLLAVHFLATDSTQHAWGSEHYLAKAALSHADDMLGRLRDAISEAGLAERTTFVIGADHGFHSVSHEVNLHPVLAASDLEERVRLHGGGWTMFLETTEDVDEARDRAALDSLFSDILNVEGVDRIVSPDEFHELGYPRYEEDPHVLGQYMILPDIDTHLVVDPTSSTTDRRPKDTAAHGHGYLPTHPRMYPSLVLSGRGIRTGVRTAVVRNLDVAPTIAGLLGLQMRDVEGRALDEALDGLD